MFDELQLVEGWEMYVRQKLDEGFQVIITGSNASLLSGECDFVAMQHGAVAELIQVCDELTPDNLKRELNGLLQAMRFFNQHKAKIVTFANADFIEKDGFEITVIPAYKYMTS